MPCSLKPKTSTESGTQQTLGKVCRPRKKPPNISSIPRHLQSVTPSSIPIRVLMANPASRRVRLMRMAAGRA